MPRPRLTTEGKAALDALLERRVAEKTLPALFFMAATKDAMLYEECRGDMKFGHPEEGQVTFDATLQLFSMTKLVTSLAILQLSERVLVGIDDPGVIERYAPELARQPILERISKQHGEITRPRTKALTLRHLLTHTSGLAYDFAHPNQMAWQKKYKPKPLLAPSAGVESISTPLMFEPGTAYAYSTGIDWAGVIVERVSGLKLGEYFEKNIFRPAGIDPADLTFYPTENIKSRLMDMTSRTDQGTGKVVLHPGWRPIKSMTPDMIGLHAGGAGLLGTLREYLKLLQHILKCETEAGVISPETFKLLFTSALPPRSAPTTIYENLGMMQAMLGDTTPEYISGDGVSHSLGLCINENDSPHGRRAGSGCWSGAAKTHFWIDPKTGIAGICATQILDMAPEIFHEVYREYERTLYDGLVPSASL